MPDHEPKPIKPCSQCHDSPDKISGRACRDYCWRWFDWAKVYFSQPRLNSTHKARTQHDLRNES